MPRALYQPFPMQARSQGQVWTYAPHYRRPRHFHDEPELNVVASGRATFGVGGRRVALSAGDVVAFTPGQDHELLQGSRDLVLFAVGLRRALCKDVMRGSKVTGVAPFRSRLDSHTLRELVRHCGEATGQAGADQAVAELWQRARDAARRSPTDDLHVLTRRAIAALDDALDLDRAHLSAAARASGSEIGRYFQRDIGLTLVAYRARLRVLRFVQRVDDGSSLTGAAFDAGFGSYSQCHRVFSAAVGCTPRDFFQPDKRRAIEDEFAAVKEPCAPGEQR